MVEKIYQLSLHLSALHLFIDPLLKYRTLNQYSGVCLCYNADDSFTFTGTCAHDHGIFYSILQHS